ncbi:MAG: Arginase, partial [Chloroflexi bacterium]|nr:Arginase [Chloroflexota bacterium]
MPYEVAGISSGSASAPAAIRSQSRYVGENFDHYDFDLQGPALDGRDIRIVDYGDVPADLLDIPSS